MVLTVGYRPGTVGGEAGKRLAELDQKQSLNAEELEEHNRLVAEYAQGQSFDLPDFRDLGVTDPQRFLDNARHVMQHAETAYEEGFFLEAVSLRMLLLDFFLRAFIVDRTDKIIEPYSRQDRIPFGRIVEKARQHGLPQELTDRLLSFNEKRVAGIHHFFLGRASYQEIGRAYRDADRLYEGIVEALVTRREKT